MVRTPRGLGVAAALTGFVLWAVVLIGPELEARVESKLDTVSVEPRSGNWYHQFTVTARRVPDVTPSAAREDDAEGPEDLRVLEPVAATSLDTTAVERITVRVTEAQHDAMRTGQRLRIHRLPVLKSVAWVVDESVLLGAWQALRAHTLAIQSPRSVEPSLGRASGLARVLSVHRVSRKRGLLESWVSGRRQSPVANFEVIVVEFWAQRMRTLVRTADVVDSRSIGDLGPGQVLQMHYDPFAPRVMRLDDGMRSVVP